MLSRSKSLLRRHGLTFGALVVVTVLTPLIFRALFDLAPRYGEVESSSPWIFLSLARSFGELWPDRPFVRFGSSGEDMLAIFISAASALGLFLASWRLNGNRVVSFAAAWIFASHPALIEVTGIAGYDERLGALFVAWAVAFQLGGGARSGRFPTRLPSRFRRMAWFVGLVALFATSHAWWIGIALILVDLALVQGDERIDWPKFPWKSYLPYLGLTAFGFLLTFFSDAGRGLSAGPPTSYAAWSVSTTAAPSPELGLGILIWMGLLAAGGLFAFGLVSGVFRGRVVLRTLSFALGWFALFVVVAPFVGIETPLAGAPIAALGAALFVPTLAWRLVLKAWPEHGPTIAAPQVPTLAEISAALEQKPLPTLSLLAPAELRWDAAVRRESGAEDRGGRGAAPAAEVRGDLDTLYADLVRPHYRGAGPAIEVADRGGRFRESTRLAVARRELAVVISGLSVPEHAGKLFEGLEGLKLHPLKDDSRWPFAAAHATAVFLPDGFSVLDRTALDTTIEAARVLETAGTFAGRVSDGEISEGRAPNLVELGALFSRGGFRIETVESAPSGGYVFVARRID